MSCNSKCEHVISESMKSLAPVFLALGTAIIVITTATGIALAPDTVDAVKISLTPYMIAYGTAVLALLISALLSSRQR